MKIRNRVMDTEISTILDVVPENEELVYELLEATKLTRIAINMYADDLITTEEKEIFRNRFKVVHKRVSVLYSTEKIYVETDKKTPHSFSGFHWELHED
jgi:hypothetical protein